MLNENIKAIRKSKGLSQQELAVKLNIVRQTVSKWEQGLSVPDSDMLISLSEVLETPVSTLLGETVIETEVDTLKAISEKLEVINLQLSQRKTTRRKILHWSLISLCAIIVIVFAILLALEGSYLGWDYSDPETAVLGVAFHSLEWLFVRVAPPKKRIVLMVKSYYRNRRVRSKNYEASTYPRNSPSEHNRLCWHIFPAF